MEWRRQWIRLKNDAVATQDLGGKSYDAAKAQWKKWGVMDLGGMAWGKMAP